jgi:uncharacterized lipoprotein NlpE involved in copper resistance
MKKNTNFLLLVLAASTLLVGCNNQSNSSSAAKSASSEAPTSSTPSSEAPSSSESSSSKETPVEQPDIFYDDGAFQFGGAGDVKPGEMRYWAGDGGAVSAHSHADGQYSLTYTNSTWAFYGIQLFYRLPYTVAGGTYKVTTTINSPAAGSITVNNSVVDLAAGANEKTFTVSTAGEADSLLAIQLGVNGTSYLANGTLTFTNPVVKDQDAKNVYYNVQFTNGDAIVKHIEVLSGKTVTALADPTPESGKLFDGWYDGTTQYVASLAITQTYSFASVFADESQGKTVTFMEGTTTLGTKKVLIGKKVIVPALSYSFGHAEFKWYKEAALTNEWALDADTVSSDVTLYAKTKIAPTATYMNSADAGWIIPAADQAWDDNGAFTVSGFKGWAQDAWTVQVNFAPVPTGTAGKTYTLSFDYKINGANADAQIYDGATIGNLVNLTGDAATHTATIVFNGGVTTAASKLTFELGKIPATVDVNFTLSALSLVENA